MLNRLNERNVDENGRGSKTRLGRGDELFGGRARLKVGCRLGVEVGSRWSVGRSSCEGGKGISEGE